MTWIGVDVGGTFTDLVSYDPTTGQVRAEKVATTPRPDDGVVTAISQSVGGAGYSDIEYFVHGTTIGLNALLQRTGGPVGLLTTRGFRDVLEVRHGTRGDVYNLFWTPPEPLVPRNHRLEVTERVDANGETVVELNEQDVRDAAARFIQDGMHSVAIVFLHSYANPGHEVRALELLRESGFTGEVSLSHAISGEYREYERTSTTVVDAYVRPDTRGYLARLEQRLADDGFDGDSMVTRSGGGAMTWAEAKDRPFESIASGPVAGAEGAAELCRQLGVELAVTADVGGTSFDTCLIVDGQPQVLYKGSVADHPVQAPWMDVRSIGAGGGSIAYVDAGGLLRVGPRSAGAFPGPACYGRGGTQPTVSDAAFVLGMLGHGDMAGDLVLDRALALAALETLSPQLDMDAESIARGIMRIAAASMSNSIREITLDRGLDARVAALMPFGGAGPMFACLLARELEATRVLLPPFAGNFSAWGLLVADTAQAMSRTRVLALDDDAVAVGSVILGELFTTLDERPGVEITDPVREVAVDMRYRGQAHAITVPLPSDNGVLSLTADEVRAIFTREYERVFAHSLAGPIEFVTWRATSRDASRDKSFERMRVTNVIATTDSPPVRAWSFERAAWAEYPIIARAELEIDRAYPGPFIMIEDTTTTYIDHGFTAELHPSGAVWIVDNGAQQ
ncbi:hydantoinase/oxoprolinase family protein [Microbacterium enclense]|uniref:hydantoinase/oxoprolinase family protein n=1 Tax=Microbacterium enclense TaxID=993073 RepID=UPI0021A7F8F7|nr:hydantoinase/oxoprolinase family protein [Microbacterium enclense]MCT2085158.1 hydantoinase/oxoprolinase family protein [Microbacterium enclense]